MITKQKPLKLATLTAIVVLLAACGQKGALYLHKEDKKPKPQSEQVKKAEQSEQDKNNTEQ